MKRKQQLILLQFVNQNLLTQLSAKHTATIRKVKKSTCSEESEKHLKARDINLQTFTIEISYKHQR